MYSSISHYESSGGECPSESSRISSLIDPIHSRSSRSLGSLGSCSSTMHSRPFTFHHQQHQPLHNSSTEALHSTNSNNNSGESQHPGSAATASSIWTTAAASQHNSNNNNHHFSVISSNTPTNNSSSTTMTTSPANSTNSSGSSSTGGGSGGCYSPSYLYPYAGAMWRHHYDASLSRNHHPYGKYKLFLIFYSLNVREFILKKCDRCGRTDSSLSPP